MLHKIGCLLKPPHEVLMQYGNFGESLKDSKVVKSLNTINSFCEEIRTYFCTEETLRYIVLGKVFSYTIIDGQRSIVAPLKRYSFKPLIKVCDHYILKGI